MAEDRERLQRAWEHSTRLGVTMAEEVRLVGPKVNWVLVSGRRKRDDSAIWSLSPLQDMKDLEMELRRTEALYNTVISNLPNGAIIFFDRDLRYQSPAALAERDRLVERGHSRAAHERGHGPECGRFDDALLPGRVGREGGDGQDRRRGRSSYHDSLPARAHEG